MPALDPHLPAPDTGVFVNSIIACSTAGLSTLGTGSPCEDRYGSAFEDRYGSAFEDTVRTTTFPALVEALRAVRRAAPNAVVAILASPWIVPASGACSDRMPTAAGDTPYLRSLQATLDDVVARAAARSGVTFVDLSVVPDGHDPCQPPGIRWIEPVLQGTNR